jgi:tRNA-splicing ligase RtcB
MRVPGLIYADAAMIDSMAGDMAIQQVANMATLPGIVCHALAMPDIHWGYGFPIGGVAAMRVEDGVVSPGGVGFDINCGVRLLRTNLHERDVKDRLPELVNQLFRDVPTGLGRGKKKRSRPQGAEGALAGGAAWAVENGHGRPEDLDAIEAGGCLPGADPSQVSERARQRGAPQLGSLGSGNHFLEAQVVETIADETAAQAFGIEEPGQVMLSIHTGSRGLGHQVCQEYLGIMQRAMEKYRIELPDRQLACAPIKSPEGQAYLGAMTAAANFAFANRQAITERTRRAFQHVLGGSKPSIDIGVVYDVAHNIAKMERHRVNGKDEELCVHRKGATRALPAGDPDVPAKYRAVGQPVLIPGDMGRYSYILVGEERARQETFASTCHGAGRVLSRGAAKRKLAGVDLVRVLRDKGIVVRAQSKTGLLEEASAAYKDVRDVVDVVERSGIARVVARVRPLGVIKG